MAASAVAAVGAIGQQAGTAATDAEKAGTAIGVMLGIGLIGAAWMFPMIGALVLGFFLRKSSVIERGPTGRLARSASALVPAPTAAAPNLISAPRYCATCRQNVTPWRKPEGDACPVCGTALANIAHT